MERYEEKSKDKDLGNEKKFIIESNNEKKIENNFEKKIENSFFSFKNIINFLLLAIIAFLFFNLGQKYSEKTKKVTLDNISKDANFYYYKKAWDELEKKHVSPFSDEYIKENKIEEPTNEDKVWNSIRGLALSYADPYTDFFPPTENEKFKEEVDKEFFGVGMKVEKVNGIFTVVSPLKGSPAEKAGIKPKDVILKIDGKNTKKLSEMESVDKIRGKKGTEVILTILRKDEDKPLEIKIIRDLIKIPTVETKIIKDISVISVNSFSQKTPYEFKKNLEEFSKRKSDKLIIDLRLNPGGYMEAALLMSSFFLEGDKLIMTEKGKVDGIVKHYSEGELHVFKDNLKLVILIDEGSASASEIMAGILSDYKKAIIVGKKSYGKGSVQELIDFTEDTSLKLTIARWYLPFGELVSQIGIIPDFEVDLDFKEGEKYDENKDSQILKAIEILNKKDFFEIRKNKKTEKEKQKEYKKEEKEEKEEKE